jgi:hypothetical protein
MASVLDVLCRAALEGREESAALYDVDGWPRDGVDCRNQASSNGAPECLCPKWLTGCDSLTILAHQQFPSERDTSNSNLKVWSVSSSFRRS